jgi:nicotinate-nucleotide adenylyltransferase
VSGRNNDLTKSNLVRAPGPAADGMRIGLLGGSFNPAHEGHLHASLRALKLLGLDYVWWLVSTQNPLKAEEGMAGFAQRLAAAKTIARHPRIVVSMIEAELGTRYTVDTVAALKRRFPRITFVWIMGSDNLLQLPRWRKWEKLVEMIPLAVVARPGSVLAARTGNVARRFARALRPPDRGFAGKMPPAMAILEGPRSPESATRLRTRSG